LEKSEGVVKVETAKKGVDALRRKEKRLLAKTVGRRERGSARRYYWRLSPFCQGLGAFFLA
jgi:hypothetical protein